ncbi:hypothetical protein Gbem_3677 [Citrifermentans bemidjiense Bem]|uniref:Uncharacterized protein n=1 Tax=Citrifermentans bemidjiense (strain ATCC BAA-1014 / DSM 16622 / JCM 12645 / Bem) TaxID=404380 RepID=B5EDP1_CITBB|nr:hypothetical protein [Citrifermentans bemidjiense]ACH40669.1 hypothetical protein Gbem_3677 [Citrifermentans bemidjiense Bem]
MDDPYFTGMVASFVINMGRIGMSLSDTFSVKSRNMKRINLHYDLTTGGYKSTPTSKLKHALVYGEMLFFSPLFSWLSAGFNTFNLIRLYFKKRQLPERVKEINFKLESVDLPKEKVRECINELATFYGLPGADFRTLSDDEEYDSNDFALSFDEDENDWVTELYLSKETKTYTITSHSPDHTSSHTTVFEYAFNSTSVKSRTIEHKFSYFTNDEYDIRNGVVLEDEVREKFEESDKYSFSSKSIEEKLADLRADTEWSEPTTRIRYFLLFRHGEVMNDVALQRFFRSEIARIELGYRQLEKEVNRMGWQVVPPDFDEQARYMPLRRQEGTGEENVPAIQKLYNDMSKFNITFAELTESDVIIKELNRYISRLE